MIGKLNHRKINNIYELLLPILIILVSTVIYLANGVTIGAGDTVPNTLLGFNLLENHTLNLDAFRTSHFCSTSYGNCYFFAEANNGHLSSTYPIGTAIITFPLYVIFYAYLKVASYYAGQLPLDLTSVSFDVHRIFFEKLAATIITSITVSIFYLSVRLKFSLTISLVSTFIFAFATNTWMTSSQGLWQHGTSNLMLTSTIYCLFKANRTSEKSQKIWLLLAGVACGFLPSIRPTSAVYVIAAIVYSVFTYRFQSIFLFFGLVSAVPSILWNLYYFSNLSGAYLKLFPVSPYLFTFNNFITASLGTLISPSRGLLLYSPIVLYSLPGVYQVFKLRFTKDEKLIGSMTIASIILLSSYGFYTVWWAGYSYGPRFMVDIIPIFCYLISYFFANRASKKLKSRKISAINYLVFTTLIAFSTLTQLVGAFGANPARMWDTIPLNINKYEYQHRLWSLKDSQIERHAQAVIHKLIKPPIDQQVYFQGLSGKITKITDENNQPPNSLISVEPGAEKVLKAKLENKGKSTWFGYQSALERGEIRVRCRFYDELNKEVSDLRLYISGNPRQNEVSEAIASITFPKEPGRYKLVFDLVSEGIGEFPNSTGKPLYELDINVGKQKVTNLQLIFQPIFLQEIKIINNIETIKVGSTLRIPIFLKNKSSFIWYNKGLNPTNFSYRWLNASGKLVVADGDRTILPFDVSPGESLAINAVIRPPTKPGKFTLILIMVQETVAWFSDKQSPYPKIDVTVTSD
ncbi:MAG: glycosyltransferase family 39 protein [Nostoc sp. JL31]|uniref:glycosyltransferase family 39 protein n=1 Tax=Nostoc sp. JL31 TaxID=2815395 RepID=UPI0025FA0CF7|nr:glycosyltransferase family 39 protein [Nostoc sp. JL31]MBN3891027.1 glycosyltransferase family 39 protein [Nostoc sp. JL31]